MSSTRTIGKGFSSKAFQLLFLRLWGCLSFYSYTTLPLHLPPPIPHACPPPTSHFPPTPSVSAHPLQAIERSGPGRASFHLLGVRDADLLVQSQSRVVVYLWLAAALDHLAGKPPLSPPPPNPACSL